VKEHRSASVLLAGLAAVLDVSGRRRTVMDDRRRRSATELGRELRLEPNDARPHGSGNGHRRRSERWRWDLNPRTGYPVTRFRDVLEVWRPWAPDLTGYAIDSGHHMAEDAPDDLANLLIAHIASPRST
jgi:hypothetical protein